MKRRRCSVCHRLGHDARHHHRHNPAKALHVGEEFTWTSPNGEKSDYKIVRTKIGVDTSHALARGPDGKSYRIAKTPDGRRPFGRPERMGR